MRLMRMASGEIARELGVTLETISRVLAEPEVQAIIAEAEADALDDAKKALRTATRRAARRMIELVSSDDERIALDAAKTLLTKAGADAPAKGEVEVSGNLTPETASLVVAIARAEKEGS